MKKHQYHLLFLIPFLIACTDLESDDNLIEDVLTLSISSDTLLLNAADAGIQAVSFNWTTGSNYGTGQAIDYILSFAAADGEYEDGCTFDEGRRVYSRTYTVKGLNDFLIDSLDAQCGIMSEFKVMIKAVLAVDGRTQTSEASFHAMTYDRSAVEPDTDTGGNDNIPDTPDSPDEPSREEGVFFVSEGNGWSFIPMTQDPIDENIYRYGGLVPNGQFKFGTVSGLWERMYVSAVEDNADWTGTSVQFVEGTSPDWKWLLWNDPEVYPYGRGHKIALDITPGKERMICRQFDAPSSLAMVGDATPYGWLLDNATRFEVSADDSYVFVWSGRLAVGEIKFVCNGNLDWGAGLWFMSTEAGKSFVSVQDEIVSFVDLALPENAGTDRKWQVTESGSYRIIINTLTDRMSITRL